MLIEMKSSDFFFNPAMEEFTSLTVCACERLAMFLITVKVALHWQTGQ